MTKRFNPDFSLSISHELAYMRETPEGGYVEHGDYATLFSELEIVKADRDALAVENAEMREAITFATAPDMWIEQHDGMLDYRYSEWYVDVLNAAVKTPATSAALAAIEASGVEKFLDSEHCSQEAHGCVCRYLDELREAK
ncbi:TPA: hypothetical protein SLN67_002602 [Serratia marcescens]|nr:hypothetical protein [Serratia marcescens]